MSLRPRNFPSPLRGATTADDGDVLPSGERKVRPTNRDNVMLVEKVGHADVQVFAI